MRKIFWAALIIGEAVGLVVLLYAVWPATPSGPVIVKVPVEVIKIVEVPGETVERIIEASPRCSFGALGGHGLVLIPLADLGPPPPDWTTGFFCNDGKGFHTALPEGAEILNVEAYLGAINPKLPQSGGD